ncbi:MAG: ATP-dependent helicase [Firmicutes bacterium HGW-Firmicutes-1]|jgi:DNA helicase-2/ATP-dependent DNA helicase PcrA|nr:MAG: ATP-dependent helicase [Firmicutes bacterium HGW-Firmicutes-1]
MGGINMEKERFFEQLKDVHKIILTEQQYEGVIHTEGRNLLLACPGSGKTTVMVIKTAYLIDVIGVLPNQVLSLTFSKAGANDMQKRFCNLFGNRSIMPQFSTIHGFCNKLMKTYFAKKGIVKENIEGNNSRNDSKKKFIALIYEKVFYKKPSEEIVEEIANAISIIKNSMFSWDNFNEYQFNIRFLKDIFRQYELYKDKYHYYDFDDMLLFGYQILVNDHHLLNKLRKQFLYIQVDEAQDNSKIQNKIISLLAAEKNNLFMVADDDQTIYEFRGADPEWILRFSENYVDSSIHHMEQNFRSSKNIVDVSNLFIQNNLNRYSKNLTTQNTSHNPIQIVKLNPSEDQYEYAIKLINDRNLSNYAFLFRNNLSALLLAYRLQEAGLKFFIKNYNETFFNHWIVNDIAAFLLFSITGRTEYFERIYYKNFAYISKNEFELGKMGVTKRHSIIDAIYHNCQRNGCQKQKLLYLKRQLKILGKNKTHQALLIIRKELGYERWMKSMIDGQAISTEGVNHIWMILDYIAKESKDFYDFLNRLNRLQITLKASSSNNSLNAVALLTLHGSKGLEFDTVFMVDLDQGVIPSLESLENIKQFEAERRLFYVGMTRAKYNLFLLSTSSKKEKSSLFINEVEKILGIINSMKEENN